MLKHPSFLHCFRCAGTWPSSYERWRQPYTTRERAPASLGLGSNHPPSPHPTTHRRPVRRTLTPVLPVYRSTHRRRADVVRVFVAVAEHAHACPAHPSPTLRRATARPCLCPCLTQKFSLKPILFIACCGVHWPCPSHSRIRSELRRSVRAGASALAWSPILLGSLRPSGHFSCSSCVCKASARFLLRSTTPTAPAPLAHASVPCALKTRVSWLRFCLNYPPGLSKIRQLRPPHTLDT